MEKPISAISSLVKLRSYYQAQYEHYLAKATASKENRERVSLLLQDLSETEIVEEALLSSDCDELEEVSPEQKWLSLKPQLQQEEQLSPTEKKENSSSNAVGVTETIEAVKVLNEAISIIAEVSKDEIGKTLHLNYFHKLLEKEMSRALSLELVKLYLDEGILRGYLEKDAFDPLCYKSKKKEAEVTVSKKVKKTQNSPRSYAYNLPPSAKLRATLIETIQEYIKEKNPRSFSIKDVMNYLYSKVEQENWSKETKNKVGSCISNSLSRKSYLNKEWKRIKVGLYRPIVKK